jgi:hypothetical protein
MRDLYKSDNKLSGFKSNNISNYIKHRWIKQGIKYPFEFKKLEATICCAQETTLKCKDTIKR